MSRIGFKRDLQKQIIIEAKKGERILDILLEYQRKFNLSTEETYKLVNPEILELMKEQELKYNTVSK